jgi:two-component system, chemotaxis family, protein-glutamate methylesterase/glutaminase
MIKLLIADDSALMRKLLGGIFSAEGDFDIRFARNGKEALELAKSFQPDVVTLDVHMPEMNGLDCLDRIMVETPRPVVMLSALTEEGAEETLQALELGAIDFMAKPDGPVSLEIEEMRPALVNKIRTAAGTKLRRSLRLRDRVRHRMGQRMDHAGAAAVPPRPQPQPRASATEAPTDIPGLVLIGASTGGPPAIEAILSSLPADFPWPLLVAQHLPASFTGTFARRLDALCAIRVVEISSPTPLRRGKAYIGRGDADIVVASRTSGPIALSAPAHRDYPWHPSVERLVTSALELFPAARLLGVMLSGMGSDGADAMTRLKAEGGRTIAESQATAVVWGMPGELVKNGGAGVVAPLGQIAATIVDMVM